MELFICPCSWENVHLFQDTLYTNILFQDVITLGLCLPASCASNNLSFILEKIFRDSLIKDLYFTDFHLIQVKDLKDDNEWLTSAALPFIWYEKHLWQLFDKMWMHIYYSTT